MNYEDLRRDLINYFGTAASFNPQAYLIVDKIRNADDDELVDIAEYYGIDTSKYDNGNNKTL